MTQFTPTRTVFFVDYLAGNDFASAEVALFYDASMDWVTDDDLARTLISILENELGEPVLLFSWGIDPDTEVANVTMERV